MKYRFIADPGHGWLEVSTEELEHLNIAKKISPFSYRSGPKAYLEEDCDLSVFMKAKEEAGEEVEFLHVFQENTPIRSYQSYKWGDA
jgi:hypothetical protein